jgi:two-component system CheB/CheR fusion protein
MLHHLTTELDSDSSPRSGAVAIIGSAGGIHAMIEVLRGLHPTFALPIIIAQHLSRSAPSILPSVLSWHTGRAAKWAEMDEGPRSGFIYVVPPGHELEICGGRFLVTRLPDDARSWLQVPDRLLCSLSTMCGADAVAVVLSGMLPVGLHGLQAIRTAGGIIIAQSEPSSAYFDMPCAGIDQGKAEIVFPPHRIAMALNVLSEQRLASAEPDQLQCAS